MKYLVSVIKKIEYPTSVTVEAKDAEEAMILAEKAAQTQDYTNMKHKVKYEAIGCTTT